MLDIGHEDEKNLIAEILNNCDEEEIAYRNEQRLIKRVEKVDGRINKKCAFDPGTYLITGGLGGLGLEVTHWLAQQGVKNIVLISRHLAKESDTLLFNQLFQEHQCVVTHKIIDVTKYEELYQYYLQSFKTRRILFEVFFIWQVAMSVLLG